MYENADWPSEATQDRPRQVYVGDRLVCVKHDYDAPDARGIQRCCQCGCERHVDSEI